MKYFKRHEKVTAEALGGKRNPFSGALDHEGDGQSDEFLVECKTAPLKTPTEYRFKFSDWWVLHRQAALKGLIPLLAIEFEGQDLYVLARHDLDDLCERQTLSGSFSWVLKPGSRSFLIRLDSTVTRMGWRESAKEWTPLGKIPIWILNLDKTYADDYGLAIIAKEEFLKILKARK